MQGRERTSPTNNEKRLRRPNPDPPHRAIDSTEGSEKRESGCWSWFSGLVLFDERRLHRKPGRRENSRRAGPDWPGHSRPAAGHQQTDDAIHRHAAHEHDAENGIRIDRQLQPTQPNAHTQHTRSLSHSLTQTLTLAQPTNHQSFLTLLNTCSIFILELRLVHRQIRLPPAGAKKEPSQKSANQTGQ